MMTDIGLHFDVENLTWFLQITYICFEGTNGVFVQI
jgi:hypothetical protein